MSVDDKYMYLVNTNYSCVQELLDVSNASDNLSMTMYREQEGVVTQEEINAALFDFRNKFVSYVEKWFPDVLQKIK